MDGLTKGHGSWGWTLKLPETMNENAFQEAKLWRLKPDMSRAKFYIDCHAVFRRDGIQVARGSLRKKEFERLVADFGEETKRGAV